MKNTIGNLIGNATESVDFLGYYGHFNNTDFSNPRTRCIFPSVCVIFNFFHQCLLVFGVQVSNLLSFIARYSILFDETVNGETTRAHQ